ncbi:MAG: polysaccharide biosynthesis protein [Muribaculaceae bacterium]|nr:polysaccharide biosynthesis protein [Muribaculaceae bacterium]
MLNFSTDNYLRSTIVLTIDTITSMIASGLVILFIHLLGASSILTNGFILTWLLIALIGSIFGFIVTSSYKLVIRFSTLRDLARICMATGIKEIILLMGISLFEPWLTARIGMILIFSDFLIAIAGLLLTRVIMLTVYWLSKRGSSSDGKKRILVYGIGDKSVAALTRLRFSTHYSVEGFIVTGDSTELNKNLVMGKPVYHFKDSADLVRIREHNNIEGILFAYLPDAREEKNGLIPACLSLGIKTYLAPSIDEIKDGKFNSGSIRNIKIEDLLGRPEIEINMSEIRNMMSGKTVLVTGAAGSIGSELCRQLATLGVKHLLMFDNAETPLHNVRLEFEEKYPSLYFSPIIGDVRNQERLDHVFKKYRPEIVFHAAAYKHVPLMEENPCEAILANVIGSRNVADKCVEYDVERMVMISTDKAVNPTNIMGCTKRLAEIYVQSLGLAIENGSIKGKTTFVTTRFGNVLGSNGSVIPRFADQIEKGGPITVTHPDIRRFFMTIPEACRLVMEAATMADGTQIFVFDMGEPVKIDDLARRMISLAGFQPDVDIAIQYTGLRPGEKLYEEVLATKENTLPTDHDRIYRAKVREYEYDSANGYASQLETHARAVQIDDAVILMKKVVPEFISKHSIFEKFDKKS